MSVDIQAANLALAGESPENIISWALSQAENPILTTNFRPFEAVIIHMAVQQRPDLKILWVDSGYNTSATYRYAQQLIQDLSLNMLTYVPAQSAAFRNVQMKGIPDVDDPQHVVFTKQVKLEPFGRALGEIKPDFWLNAIRKDQTEFRNTLDLVSSSRDGVIKVAPLFNWNETQLQQYLDQHQLSNETDYFDPTKVEEARECGLHTQI